MRSRSIQGPPFKSVPSQPLEVVFDCHAPSLSATESWLAPCPHDLALHLAPFCCHSSLALVLALALALTVSLNINMMLTTQQQQQFTKTDRHGQTDRVATRTDSVTWMGKVQRWTTMDMDRQTRHRLQTDNPPSPTAHPHM